MIRLGLPMPSMLRLRLRAQLAAGHLNRRVDGIRQEVLASVRDDAAALRRAWAAARTGIAICARRLCPARTVPLEFDARYQDLVDLLCWSAKEGAHDGRDARYSQLRAWFLSHYDAVRPALSRYLVADPEDAAVSHGPRRARDAFESLFLPDDVAAIINSETVISRISRTRSALDAYRAQAGTPQ